MALAITIGSVLLLIVLGVVGLWRGVPRGLLSLVSTLLGAALVDVWLSTWGERMQSWLHLERQQTSTWLAATLGFLIVALFIGYGIGQLVPRSVDDALAKARLRMLAAPLAALLGVLNGALIVGYLLRYTTELLRRTDVTAAIQSTLALRMLTLWLPWFLMAVVLATGGLVLARMIIGMIRLISAPRAPAKTAPAATVPAATAPTLTTPRVADTPTTVGKMGAVSNKIDQVLGEKKP